MLTDEDIKKLKKTIVTKKDFEENHQRLVLAIVKNQAESNDNLEKVEKKFDDKFDQVMTKLDAVYGEVKAARQEQAVHSQTHEDINDRFTKIESLPTIAHELKK